MKAAWIKRSARSEAERALRGARSCGWMAVFPPSGGALELGHGNGRYVLGRLGSTIRNRFPGVKPESWEIEPVVLAAGSAKEVRPVLEEVLLRGWRP